MLVYVVPYMRWFAQSLPVSTPKILGATAFAVDLEFRHLRQIVRLGAPSCSSCDMCKGSLTHHVGHADALQLLAFPNVILSSSGRH